MSLITWTTLSVRGIAAELTAAGHPCGKNAVLRLLHEQGFSTQGNSRAVEGKRHPDRDAQFRYVSETAKRFLAAGDPVISIDAKKKELVGLYAQKGTEWRARGDPRRVRDHDFPDPGGGKAIPYGVYDIGDNSGFVNVGTDHDTAQFAAESVRRWWHARGRDRYPHAARLLVTCDAGGSNGYRARAWKAELARLAAQTGLGACQVVCVSDLGFLAEVGGEAVGEVQGQGAEGLLPVLDDGAFDEAGGGFALVAGLAFLGGAGPGALVLDVADGQP